MTPHVYRGRLAPSPTGYMHVGHARTFWTAWQRARAASGVLILRNEDLDQQRSRPEFATAMIEDLRWLGLRWQEGPDVGGPRGPYIQSRRRSFYYSAWFQLLRSGAIYPCRCSRKDLEAISRAPHEAYPQSRDLTDDEPIYPGTCRNQAFYMQLPGPTSEPPSPAGVNWRFRVNDGEVVEFVDRFFGPQRFVAGRDFGDFLVWRRDDVPSYQLAVVVDDASMRITEVVRGADLLKSTARQILLMRALRLPEPQWYHCPLVTDATGQRLAKRHDALALRTLRHRGITPMAILSTALQLNS